MKIPTSTVRLAAVVKQCGQPQPVTLWVKPKKDKALQTALAENRVLTVKQETVGSRKDFGVVGFHREKNVSYWIFPKPLDDFKGKRVIGIDYALLNIPERHKPESPDRAEAPRERNRPPRAPSKAAPAKTLRRFRVTVRYVSTLDVLKDVEAANKKEAREKALERIAGEKVDFSKGTQSRRAVRIEKMAASAPSAAALFRRLRGLPDLPNSSEED